MGAEPAPSDYLNLSSKTSTFVSIDVVGSTALKAGENEQDVIYTFLSYHRLVSQVSYTHHGEVINITGDGIMCRFQVPADAVRAVHAILTVLPSFNKKQNHLSRPIAVRLGVHTGQVFESDTLSKGQIISKTIDIAAKLQQEAPTDQAYLSEATHEHLKELDLPFTKIGWNTALQLNVYQLGTGSTRAAVAKTLPSPVKVLLVEQELDEIIKLQKILAMRQHEPLPAFTQGQAALCAQAWNPHVILLSADLPWDGGWQLLDSLRNDDKYSSTPILVMSRQSTGQSVERALAKGANGFLRKPLEEQQIAKRVEMALREFYL